MIRNVDVGMGAGLAANADRVASDAGFNQDARAQEDAASAARQFDEFVERARRGGAVDADDALADNPASEGEIQAGLSAGARPDPDAGGDPATPSSLPDALGSKDSPAAARGAPAMAPGPLLHEVNQGGTTTLECEVLGGPLKGSTFLLESSRFGAGAPLLLTLSGAAWRSIQRHQTRWMSALPAMLRGRLAFGRRRQGDDEEMDAR